MNNMVYQGTVWGPPLWNCFYKDARSAIRAVDFTEIVYADDLNAFKAYPNINCNNRISEEIKAVQSELHSWGRANRVEFDESKESMHIISKVAGFDSHFRLIGVEFDSKIIMDKAVQSLVIEASWKLKSILRSKQFFNDTRNHIDIQNRAYYLYWVQNAGADVCFILYS